jgi:hypothetical protein
LRVETSDSKFFRKRTAEQIVKDKFITGCTDSVLVFVTAARACGLPAKYVETVDESWLKNGGVDITGHQYAEVYDEGNKKWFWVDPMGGRVDTPSPENEGRVIYKEGLDSWDIGITDANSLKEVFVSFRDGWLRNRGIENPVTTETMKPSVLYHASENRSIEVLEPRAESIRNENEGSVVFATPDKAEASKFLVSSDDTWTRKMRFDGVHVHIIADRKRYEEADKGGAIYHLKPDTFENDVSKGTRTEWTSKISVRPYEKEEYTSGLQAQFENGVQVYFIDRETFDQIVKANDHGVSIIKGLVSENKIRNINVKEIPTSEVK